MKNGEVYQEWIEDKKEYNDDPTYVYNNSSL